MIPMGTKVVYIERLVWQDNEPIAIDKIYIEDARFPDFITTLSKDRSFYQVMDECYHIRPNHSVLEIDGKAAQSHSADTLKCNVGDPLFSIHKISYDQDGKPIHYSLTTVRCDRVTYVVELRSTTEGRFSQNQHKHNHRFISIKFRRGTDTSRVVAPSLRLFIVYLSSVFRAMNGVTPSHKSYCAR